ncbi:MAG TPA: SpoIIE family protein phosphatase [Thermoanaerobaculia bacterium]|nr:SpoIIE family protein phosphatase [Thermoanaerobaculia bacterium]
MTMTTMLPSPDADTPEAEASGAVSPEPPTHPSRELAWLVEATQELNAAGDLRSGLERIALRLRDVIPYDNLAVLLLDERGQDLRPEVTVGYPPGVSEHWRFGLGQGIVGTVALTGEPLHSPDVRSDPRYLDAAPGTRSELAMPLKVKDRVIGVLDLGCLREQSFCAGHQRLLELLSSTLASAIDTQRLHENTRAQARMLSILHELSRELTSILDRERVLEQVAKRLRPHVPYDVLTISLWDEDAQLLRPWLAVRGEQHQHKNRSLTLGEGISGSAAALRQTIRVPNVSIDPRFVGCDATAAVKSEMAVPLVFEDRLIGVLDVESHRYDAFSLEHEMLLSTLGSSIAIAMENARMYESVRATQRELDRDLSTARKIQRQLLPTTTPWAPGLQIAVAAESARHLGGDLHDFLPYQQGRFAIAVGDVAGKGASAALLGALTIGILREIAPRQCPCPAEILTSLNARLRALEVERRFVALGFAAFDPGRRRVTMANAGLPYPLLLRGGRAREVTLGGLPLGGLAEARWEETELELQPGDTLVLLTDGVSETERDGVALDGRGLMELVESLAGGSARELADGLLAAVKLLDNKAAPHDDRTIVVVRSV